MEEVIRLSCACLARVMIDDKYLLVINHKEKEDKETYKPIGGALEYKNNALNYLLSLGATFEKNKDLRLSLPSKNYNIFKSWFISKKKREISCYREFREEMLEEEQCFKVFNLKDYKDKLIDTIESSYDWIINNEIKTSYYFFEIYDIKLSDEKITEIKEFIKNNNSLKLFSKEEILNDESITYHTKFILK